jgi:hypothetical protein
MRLCVQLTVLLATSLLGAAPADRIERCFANGDYALAARLIEGELEQSPNDKDMLYNAACAWSLLGEPDRAVAYLRRSVEAGFRDLQKIRTDADLDAIRDHLAYKAIVDRLGRQPTVRRGDPQEQWRAIYGTDRYRYSRDDGRRIAYATALDPTSQQEMERMIDRQADQLRATLFVGDLPDYWLLIAVPTPADAARLFGDERTGGMYEHEKRRLIARDTGASLRHELVHALHYAHMMAINQKHPLWIQEGIAALYESYVLSADGSITFLPNERTNVVCGLARAGKLKHWDELFPMSAEEFMEEAPRLYPQVRSIFEFLAERGMLVRWYEALQATVREDPTGSAAMVEAFGKPLREVEREWRRWVMSKPPVDLEVEAGDAALGIETRPNGSNDGVLVTRVLPGSAASRSDLKTGDVIVAVDGQPTRTLAELAAVIASRSVGDRVSVRARRAREYFQVEVALRPLWYQ